MSNDSTHGDTAADQSGHAGGRSDRMLGAAVVLVAIWYTMQARTYDGTGFGSGPVGPKTLPTGLGVCFGLCGLYLIAKPDAAPGWPTRSASRHIALVLGASYLYGQLLEPLGFIVASAAMVVFIAALFRAPWRSLLPLSIVFPIVVAYIFNNWLSLRLPAGWWGGF